MLKDMKDWWKRWFGGSGLGQPNPTVEGEFCRVEVNPTPKLDRIFALLKDELIRQFTQPGGPNLDATMEMHVTCDDDPVLKRVLEVKGGSLGIRINLIPTLTPEQVEQQKIIEEEMARMRTVCGVQAPPELVAAMDRGRNGQ